MALPIDPQQLFDGTVVEWARIECKENWNPEPILHTICAFANDLQDWNGGYVLVGVGERDGRPELPPTGLDEADVDKIQKGILQLAYKIHPPIVPIVEPVMIAGKRVVVVWVPGGQNRPYKAPRTLGEKEARYGYYVRLGSTTKLATGELESELWTRAAKVPFDDRMHHHASLGDLQLRLVQAHLQEVGSALFEASSSMEFAEVCERMRLLDGPREARRPRNVALMFFSDHPEHWFETAWIDVVQMPDGPAGSDIREKRFTGPLDVQLRSALAYLEQDVVEERVVKRTGRAEAERYFTYPYDAIKEALANAVYHRGYDVREPVEVRITPEAITITSYPGPDAGIARDALVGGRLVARRYRNRRIGEFLKELRLTEGRGTGVPKILQAMQANGSPMPSLDWDEARTSFTVTLPIHTAALRVPEPIVPDSGAQVDEAEVDLQLERPRVRALLEFCAVPRSRHEIAEHLGLRDIKNLREGYLRPLIAAGLLEYTQPDRVASRTQRYRTSKFGVARLRS